MTLYHGSDQVVKTLKLRTHTKTLDFGSGLYTTTNKVQAMGFAIKVYERSVRAGNVPQGKFISIYEADYETMRKELVVLHFESANEEWFDFVIANRLNVWQGVQYDVIYGPVANDTIYRTLLAFENGILSKTETIAKLKASQLFDQMVFASEKAFSFLKFSSFLEVPNG